MKQSLGLLEVSGLAWPSPAPIAMAKAAAITAARPEKTNGSGWMVVKIAGDVASVQAAVMTGAELAGTAAGAGSAEGYRQARGRPAAGPRPCAFTSA